MNAWKGVTRVIDRWVEGTANTILRARTCANLSNLGEKNERMCPICALELLPNSSSKFMWHTLCPQMLTWFSLTKGHILSKDKCTKVTQLKHQIKPNDSNYLQNGILCCKKYSNNISSMSPNVARRSKTKQCKHWD